MKLLTAKHRLGRVLFLLQSINQSINQSWFLKQVFGPRTAKPQPIWIKFCTHLLLYGIHLWADLDRDRCVGGSRPKQNDCFVILVTHPKCYIETTDRCDFGGKPSKWRWGRVLSWKFRNFVAWAEPDPKTTFFAFLGYSQYRKQFQFRTWAPWV